MGNLFGGNSTSDQKSSQATTSTAGASSPASTGASSPVNTGTQLNLSQGASVDATPAIESQAFNVIASVVDEALKGQASQTSSEQTSSSDLLSQVLAADQATAANSASGGQTNTNKTTLWIVGLAAAAILALNSKKPA